MSRVRFVGIRFVGKSSDLGGEFGGAGQTAEEGVEWGRSYRTGDGDRCGPKAATVCPVEYIA